MIRWAALATSGSDQYSIDWNSQLPSGATLSSVAYTPEPTNGISFSSASVSSGVSTVTVTAGTLEQEYLVKCAPTLSTGAISPMTVRIKILKHVYG